MQRQWRLLLAARWLRGRRFGVGLRLKEVALRMYGAAELFAKVLDGLVQAVFQRDARLPIDDALRSRNIRFASLRIVFDSGHLLDARLTANEVANDDGELCERHTDNHQHFG